MGGSIYLPTDCPAVKCKFHPYRLGRGGGSKGTVIRKYCMECVGDSYDEIKNCTDLDCPLYPYRFGHAPVQELLKNGHNECLSVQDSTKAAQPI